MVGFSAGGDFTPLASPTGVDGRAAGVRRRARARLAQLGARHRSRPRPPAAAVAALGIENGPSYTQLRIGPDGPKVIEVAARLGGGHDAELVEAVTGVDLNGLAIDAALGDPRRAGLGRRARRRRGDAVPRRAAGRARVGRGAGRPRRVSSGSGSTASPATSSRRCAAAPTGPARCSPSAARATRPSRGRTPRPTAYASSPRMPELSVDQTT